MTLPERDAVERDARSPQPSHWLAIGALTLMWGSAYALIEVALVDLTPLQMTAGRVMVAAVLLYLWLRARGQRLPSGLISWAVLTAVGLLGNALPFFLTSFGQQTVSSGMAGILLATVPLFVVVLAHFFIAEEPLTLGRACGFALGFSGVVVLFGTGGETVLVSGAGLLLGKLALLSAALSFALTAILVLRAPRFDLLAYSTGVMITSTLMLIPASLLIDGSPAALFAEPPWAGVASVVALGVFVTGLPALVYFYLVTEVGAGFQAQANFLIPLWAILLGWLAFGETLDPRAYIAMALIFLGLFVVRRFGDGSRILLAWPVFDARRK